MTFYVKKIIGLFIILFISNIFYIKIGLIRVWKYLIAMFIREIYYKEKNII